MKSVLLSLFLTLLIYNASAQNADSAMMRKIYDEILSNGQAYSNLEYLCKKVGPRLSGSANYNKAVEWGRTLMEKYGFDKVYLQEVMVPHWERGAKEAAYFTEAGKKTPVSVAALGGSIATPAAGITAQVLEVQNFEELKALGDRVKGKIVFYNRPFNPKYIDAFLAYRDASNQRGQGAVEAAKLGAVGVVVRSMTGIIDDHPHTGGMRYADDVTKIPAVAISTKAADLLSQRLKAKSAQAITFYMKVNSRSLPDAKTYTVIGEIKGIERPDEIITVGGHLDSWDLAEGAHDDGAGIVQSIEVLRAFKAMGYKPKHTLRAVLFANEENGVRGGSKYAELAKTNGEKHLAAVESDAGGFSPRGFSIDAKAGMMQTLKNKWTGLFEPYQSLVFATGSGGVDISPLKTVFPDIVLIGLKPDSQRYFDIHHASSDVFENVNKRELELGAGAMASIIYLIDQHRF